MAPSGSGVDQDTTWRQQCYRQSDEGLMMGSDAGITARRLTLELYLGTGFGDLVRRMRHQRGITPTVEVPADGADIPCPAGLGPDGVRQWHLDLFFLARRVLSHGLPPFDWQDFERFRATWARFFACCLLYDPPGDRLLEFAAAVGPPAEADGEPAIWPSVGQRDPIAEAAATSRYWTQIVERLIDRSIGPRGYDRDVVLRQVVGEPGVGAMAALDANRRRPLAPRSAGREPC